MVSLKSLRACCCCVTSPGSRVGARRLFDAGSALRWKASLRCWFCDVTAFTKSWIRLDGLSQPMLRRESSGPASESSSSRAARVLTRTRKYDHIRPILSTLHWLPIKHRIDFKILFITYKALNSLAPQYLSELLSHNSPPRPLRSQNSGHLIIPRISKSTVGGRSFFYLAHKLWNNLTSNVREADTLCQFKSRLKTHLFNLAYT